MSAQVIIIIAAVMLIVGTVFAMVWWALADVIFPGTSEKTGQDIITRRGKGAPPPDARVVTDFNKPPPDS